MSDHRLFYTADWQVDAPVHEIKDLSLPMVRRPGASCQPGCILSGSRFGPALGQHRPQRRSHLRPAGFQRDGPRRFLEAGPTRPTSPPFCPAPRGQSTARADPLALLARRPVRNSSGSSPRMSVPSIGASRVASSLVVARVTQLAQMVIQTKATFLIPFG